MENLKQKELEQNLYNPDVEVLNKYQSFSKELTRISLLCIGILGFLLQKLIFIEKDLEITNLIVQFQKNSFILYLSMSSLILSTAFSIFHLYFSTDAFTHIISIYRKIQEGDLDRSKKERNSRNKDFTTCYYLLLFSCIFLILGIILGGIFYIKLLP